MNEKIERERDLMHELVDRIFEVNKERQPEALRDRVAKELYDAGLDIQSIQELRNAKDMRGFRLEIADNLIEQEIIKEGL